MCKLTMFPQPLPLRAACPSSLARSIVCRACQRGAQRPLSTVLPRSRTFSSSRSLHIESNPPKNESPFRKALKEANKKKKKEGREGKGGHGVSDARLDKWELTVGIEIHAELNTARKLFSAAATSLADTPNSHAALFDAAFPGSQPQFQRETLIPALRAALALNCEIQHRSSFDRKHYFYQDQPAGYQITQYYGM